MKNLMSRLFKRRKFIIYRKLQLTLMLISFSYVIVFCIVMGTYLFIPLLLELNKFDLSSEKALMAANQILYLHERFWPALLLSLVAIGFHSVYISHKIAGPLYRFNLVFKSIKDGIVPTLIHLRETDYLYSEMENINQMLERLREKLTEIQEAHVNLNSSITKCRATVSHSSLDELIKRMDDLGEQGKKLGDKLGYFKINCS